MRGLALILGTALVSDAGAALACISPRGASPRDVLAADVIVVGRLGPLEVVPSRLRPDTGGSDFEVGYAHLAIDVEKVLHGAAPDRILATWTTQHGVVPEPPPPGEVHVVALRWPDVAFTTAAGMEVSSDPERAHLAVIDLPCGAGPLMLDARSEDGCRVIAAFHRTGSLGAVAETLARAVRPRFVGLEEFTFDGTVVDLETPVRLPGRPVRPIPRPCALGPP